MTAYREDMCTCAAGLQCRACLAWQRAQMAKARQPVVLTPDERQALLLARLVQAEEVLATLMTQEPLRESLQWRIWRTQVHTARQQASRQRRKLKALGGGYAHAG